MIARYPRALAIAFALAALAAAAQMPGGQRRSRPEGQPAPDRAEPAPRTIRAADPAIALERELPSLRTDLGLSAEQSALWGPFERSLRDAAELTRQRLKKFLAPRPVDVPAPNAPSVLSVLATDERMRADAMADAAGRLAALYDVLTPAQRALFDRRVLLSQSDPLGTQ